MLENDDSYKTLKYPESPRLDLVEVLHEVKVPDPYRWLEDIDSPETREWVSAQSELSREQLELIPERSPILKRLSELWNYEKFDVPVKKAGRIFYTMNDGMQNQSVLYWMDGEGAKPQVLLDPNTLSEDGTVALMQFAVSEDGKLLAYGLSSAGSDWQQWRFRQVDDSEDLEDQVDWVKFSGSAWTHDGQGFFYSRYDPPEEGQAYKGPNYYQKLYFHRLGTPQSQDELVYERADQREWGFHGEVSEDGRYLVLSVWEGTRQENAVFYKDLREEGPVVELLDQFDSEYSYVGNDGTLFYFLTDLDAPMYRVIAVDLDVPERSQWYEVIPEMEDTLQQASRLHGNFTGLYLHNAHSQIRIFNREGKLVREVGLPGFGSVIGFQGRSEDRDTFFMYTSFTVPGEIYRYDGEEDRMELFMRPRLNFDPEDYTTRQVFYLSKDGTRIPMFITHKKGLKPNPDTPTYLYGYGGFNISQTPAFSPTNLAWMEKGGVFALANLRGGGEFGKEWHEAGTKLRKQNVFDDFISAAQWLIENEFTSSRRLVIGGRSNGGLLTAACLTQRPDLFGACLVIVGVLDMLRFHKFTIGWGWVSDYGSVDDPEEFKALLSYSPYHNVPAGVEYPPTLIATGDHDDRVYPAHSFKFAAALQHAQAGTAPVLIRIDTRAGHGLGKPTSKLVEESADLLAFMAHHTYLKP
jgi:prolyl oligopeptidase